MSVASIWDDWDNWSDVSVPNENVWANVTLNGERISMFLKEDVLQWLEQRGPRHTMRQAGIWRYSLPITDLMTIFHFQDANMALLFKLTWG